jgi:hypothetical protein
MTIQIGRMGLSSRHYRQAIEVPYWLAIRPRLAKNLATTKLNRQCIQYQLLGVPDTDSLGISAVNRWH